MIDQDGLPVQVRVVDDGSGAAEESLLADYVGKLRARYSFLLEPLLLKQNQGKGGAVYSGWDAAPSDTQWVGFIDADGSIPAREASRMLRDYVMRIEGVDGFMGSRIVMMGRTVVRSPKRHLSGRVFATLVWHYTRLNAYDTQCGFKVFKRECYTRVRSLLTERRFCFDVELLALMVDAGYELREVPLDWFDELGSKVKLLRDSWRMACALRLISKQREHNKQALRA